MPSRDQRRPVGEGLRRVRSRRRAFGAAHAHRRAGRRLGALGRGAHPASEAARGSARPAGVRDAPSARGGRHGAARRAAERSRGPHAGVCGRPRAGDRGRSDAARSGRLSVAHPQPDRGRALVALGRGRRDSLQGRGVGVDARRRAAPAGLGRPGRCAAAATARAGSPISAGSSSSASRPSVSSCGPRTIRRSGCTRRSAWSTSSTTARCSSSRARAAPRAARLRGVEPRRRSRPRRCPGTGSRRRESSRRGRSPSVLASEEISVAHDLAARAHAGDARAGARRP